VLEAARKQWDEETPAQWQDCTECAERAKRVEKERDEVRKRLEQQTDWYQQRFNRLRKWVKEEVEPLSKEVAHRYFSICANGSPAPHESADWTDTMHGLKLRAEQAEKQLDETLFKCEQAELGLANGEEELAEVRQERDELRDRLEAITHEFECTIEYADTRGTGGVSLPFYGDFAPVVQLPSVISRMRRWAKILREVLEKTK
jgi:chromosome segregation ATPase